MRRFKDELCNAGDWLVNINQGYALQNILTEKIK